MTHDWNHRAPLPLPSSSQTLYTSPPYGPTLCNVPFHTLPGSAMPHWAGAIPRCEPLPVTRPFRATLKQRLSGDHAIGWLLRQSNRRSALSVTFSSAWHSGPGWWQHCQSGAPFVQELLVSLYLHQRPLSSCFFYSASLLPFTTARLLFISFQVLLPSFSSHFMNCLYFTTLLLLYPVIVYVAGTYSTQSLGWKKTIYKLFFHILLHSLASSLSYLQHLILFQSSSC